MERRRLSSLHRQPGGGLLALVLLLMTARLQPASARSAVRQLQQASEAGTDAALSQTTPAAAAATVVAPASGEVLPASSSVGTATCGNTSPGALPAMPFNCSQLGAGWRLNSSKAGVIIDLSDDYITNGLKCCSSKAQSESAQPPTCGNGVDGKPFDCEAALGPGWVLGKGRDNMNLTNDPIIDGLTCCDKKVAPGDPADLYVELEPKEKTVSPVIGGTLEITLVIGVKGLGTASANNVILTGDIPGFEVTGVLEASSNQAAGPACSFSSSCPIAASLKCIWANVSPTTPRRVVLSLKARDAGVGQIISSFGVKASNSDSNPSNNNVQLIVRMKAACCATDGTCSHLLRAQCDPNLAFSPTASCEQSPCISVPSPTRGAGPAGICVRKSTCLERMKQTACLSSNGKWYDSKLCKSVRAASTVAC